MSKHYQHIELQGAARIVGDKVAARIEIDGGGATITTGAKGVLGPFPWDVDITGWTLLGDQSGSIVIDIWSDTYANYPPVDADSITASAPPTMSSVTKNASTTLTGWTVRVPAGNILRFNVDSVTALQWVQLLLDMKRVLP